MSVNTDLYIPCIDKYPAYLINVLMNNEAWAMWPEACVTHIISLTQKNDRAEHSEICLLTSKTQSLTDFL